jgi:putative membrane protein
MGREVVATTGVAVFVFLWNMLTGGYDDLNQVHHDAILSTQYLPVLAMPQAPFTLSSSSLGLLLGTSTIL